jgi:acyl dehydratase
MPINPAEAVAAEPRITPITWSRRDVQLYHLVIGAGSPATDPGELRYTYEPGLHVLPGFATVAGGGMPLADGLWAPGVDVDLASVLHGGQTIGVHRPLPAEGSAVRTSRITAVYDKGKAAIIVLRSDVADADGPLWTSEARIYVRGEGGFGGERGPSGRPDASGANGTSVAGDHAPDATVHRAIREDQALLYRLSGDLNPLHADSEFARAAGYDRPILHGLCSYGMVLKAVVDTALDGEVERVRSYAARFAGVVFPGETLRIRMRRQDGGRLHVVATAVERDDAPVLTDTVVDYAARRPGPPPPRSGGAGSGE